jgi:hypothetical protein
MVILYGIPEEDVFGVFCPRGEHEGLIAKKRDEKLIERGLSEISKWIEAPENTEERRRS